MPGFGTGGYGVQLQVQQTATAQAKRFAAPLTIHIPPRGGPLAPMYSTRRRDRTAAPPLFGGALPTGAHAGYTRSADGSLDIQTTIGGFFALLPERRARPRPPTLTGHFSHGALVLSWPKSTDAERAARSYQGHAHQPPLLTITGRLPQRSRRSIPPRRASTE